jgi:hypothetical protein
MTELAKKYNGKHNNLIQLQTDPEIHKVLTNNIAIPMDYEEPILSMIDALTNKKNADKIVE